MAKEEQNMFGEVQASSSVKDRLALYLANWPLFVTMVALSVGAGIFYSRYTTQKFMASTSYVIKGFGGDKANSGDLIESALNSKGEINLNSEILLVSSANLMLRTVKKNNFNIQYFQKGRILNVNIYKDAPFRLVINRFAEINQWYNFHITKMDVKGGTFYLEPDIKKTYSYSWNYPVVVNNQIFSFVKTGWITSSETESIVRIEPYEVTAANLSANLVAKPYDTKTNVILLSLKTENLKYGKDVLDALFTEFNNSDIEDRTHLSDSTVSFINDRLETITNELRSVEGNMEDFTNSRRLTDIKGQASQSLENASDMSKVIKNINIQQQVAGMIKNYFASPDNNGKLVPSSLGLNDPTLASLIGQYNDLQLKRERELPLNASGSIVIQDLNGQLMNLKSSILESLNNVEGNLRLQESNFQQQNNQYNSFLSALPHNERVMQEIKRKQSITEGLYLYLLQKREEAAISHTAANVSHYKQIDPATGFGPIEPNSRNIILYTTLLGITIAFGIVYVRELMNDKILKKEELTRKLSLPVAGEISHINNSKQALVINGRTLPAEEFRAVRTNIFSLLGPQEKVILVTSPSQNEGKTFVSMNLAAVCTIPGKKVALLEFDLRQPSIANALQLTQTKGISDYLSGHAISVKDIATSVPEFTGLDVFLAGATPSNPADALLSENTDRFIALLRQTYDYIIIDTPPAGLLSDAFVLGKYCDLVLYVLRYGKTKRNEISVISEMAANKSFKKIMLVLNDKKSARKRNKRNSYYAEA